VAAQINRTGHYPRKSIYCFSQSRAVRRSHCGKWRPGFALLSKGKIAPQNRYAGVAKQGRNGQQYRSIAVRARPVGQDDSPFCTAVGTMQKAANAFFLKRNAIGWFGRHGMRAPQRTGLLRLASL
jgi:hypothetical protein